jgi:hypothetical protein
MSSTMSRCCIAIWVDGLHINVLVQQKKMFFFYSNMDARRSRVGTPKPPVFWPLPEGRFFDHFSCSNDILVTSDKTLATINIKKFYTYDDRWTRWLRTTQKIVKKRVKNREISRTVGTQGVSWSRKNPIFWHFSSFFHADTCRRKIFNVNNDDGKIFKEHFNYLHGEGFPISSRSKYEGKWGKMGFLTKTQKILFQETQVTRTTWVLNKNLHVTTSKKGSKMTKKRGSKKGQKWPKNGGPKKGQKRTQNRLFLSSQKSDELKRRLLNI